MPAPLPRPASSAQAKSVPVGEPCTGSATRAVQSSEPVWATTATDQADVRRDSRPPMKSERP